jgi:hypothetical protein
MDKSGDKFQALDDTPASSLPPITVSHFLKKIGPFQAGECDLT